MIAIPDFVSGAMEHWGLVTTTFRETALLYDKSTSSTENKERVGTVVAHELARTCGLEILVRFKLKVRI